jgi:hypothetical protein
MTFLASRKGIAILLLAIGIGLLANVLLYWVAPQVEARAKIGEEVDVVPLTGWFTGVNLGEATIYARIGADGQVAIGYYEISKPAGASEAIVYHSVSKDAWGTGARVP